MRAWRRSENGYHEIELPLPRPASDQVLVAVEAMAFAEPEPNAELTPGGAAVGRVVACGEAATHLAEARVLLGPAVPCGECDVCRRGAAAVCPRGEILGRSVDGTMASHVLASARWVCPLTEELDISGPAAAVIPGDLALAFAMIARAGLGPGEPVVIADDDSVSRFLLHIAVELGTTPIIVTDDAEFRTEVEGAGGRAISAQTTQSDSLISAASAMAQELQLGERPWRIFAASPAAYPRAMALLGPGATVVAGGDRDCAVEVSLSRMSAMGATLVGVPRAHPDLLTETAALVATNAIKLDTHVELRAISEVAAGPTIATTHGRSLVLTLPT